MRIADVATLLVARSGSSADAVAQIRETVVAHLAERGMRSCCVFSAAPVTVVFAEEIADLAAASLGMRDEHSGSRRQHMRTTMWVSRAAELRRRQSGS